MAAQEISLADQFDELLDPARNQSRREVIVSPEVAKLFVQGVPIRKIAALLGVSYATLNNYRYSAEMKILIEREARRVLMHLPTRKLSEVPYDKLVASVATLVTKTQELDRGPINEGEAASRDVIQSIAIAIFGSAVIGGRTDADGEIRVVDSPGTRQVFPEPGAGSAEVSPEDDLGSEAPGLLRQP